MKSTRLVDKLIPVLFEDDIFLAVSKPSGVDVGGSAEGHANGVAEILMSLKGRSGALHPVNRLSRFESGVLLFAKNELTARTIRTALKSHRIVQQFDVLVRGTPKRQVTSIDVAHGSSQGRRPTDSKGYFRRGVPKSDGENPSPPLGDRARTVVRLVSRGERTSLVRCQTSIATTHALRAQLRAVRMQPIGDRPTGQSHRKPNPESTCFHLAEIRFVHPGRDASITVKSKTPPSFSSVVGGKVDITRRLAAALTRRLPLIDRNETDAYRLLSGDAEAVNGLIAERFGEVVVLQASDDRPGLKTLLRPAASWYQKTLGLRGVYVKQFARNRAAMDDDQVTSHFSPRPLVGQETPPAIKIRERGLNYVVRPYDGSSAGFFPDQRDNRSTIRKLAGGKDVLNLFAYTCSFSVAAAAGGAASTVSVDLSGKTLDWGRENFAANHLPLDGHSFITADVTDYLKRARREDQSFDVIVVDPPSFAHGRKRGRSFSITRDLPDLLRGVIALLRPNGVLILSTNHRRSRVPDLRQSMRQGAGRRKFRGLQAPKLPADFAMDPDHAKTLIVQFE
ncbi:MAG: class I SAM-dependent methyltransferase [Planctomycetes bacterium]|nr:class I SAM-dependent methyltransferase [Planctomycetota bacterium]